MLTFIIIIDEYEMSILIVVITDTNLTACTDKGEKLCYYKYSKKI